MTDVDLANLRTQLEAARARAPAPSTSLNAIALALLEHVRFERAVGHLNTAHELSKITDQLIALVTR
jgi:hypothetical protein